MTPLEAMDAGPLERRAWQIVANMPPGDRAFLSWRKGQHRPGAAGVLRAMLGDTILEADNGNMDGRPLDLDILAEGVAFMARRWAERSAGQASHPLPAGPLLTEPAHIRALRLLAGEPPEVLELLHLDTDRHDPEGPGLVNGLRAAAEEAFGRIGAELGAFGLAVDVEVEAALLLARRLAGLRRTLRTDRQAAAIAAERMAAVEVCP